MADILVEPSEELEAVDSTLDVSDETEPVETDASETVEGQENETEAEVEDEGPLVVNGNKLSASAKATLDAIKAENPRLHGQLRTAIFESDALKRAFPNGLKEAKDLAAFAQEIGGKEGFEGVKGELDQWHDLDKRYRAADPSFVEELAASEPSAFFKLAPEIFERFAKDHNEAYSKYVCSVFTTDLVANNIPLALERLQDFIGDNPKAMAQFGVLQQYLQRVWQTSQQKVAGPAQKAAETNQPNVTEQADNLTKREWSMDANQTRKGIFDTEFSRLSAGRKVSETQKAAILELYVGRMTKALEGIPGHKDKVNSLFSSKNKNGYMQYMNSTYKQQIPAALRSAFNSVVQGKPGPRAVPGTPTRRPVGVVKPGGAKAEVGFTMVAKMPTSNEIDYHQTTREMVRENKCVKKDGTKVQWR